MVRFLKAAIMVGGLLGMISGASAESPRVSKIVEAGPARIEVIAEGEGPLVVMLPSRGRDSIDYDAVAAAIAAKGFRVLRPQPRGIGKSVGPMDALTLHDFGNDIAAVIGAEKSGPAVIVGHAYGNFVARMTAVDHQSLVRGIVLAAAAAKSYPPELSIAVTKVADPSIPEAERRRYLEQAFFAPGHDASVWLGGWYAEASRSQRVASDNTKQAEWWAAGEVPLLDLQAGKDPFKPQASRNELKDEFGDRVTVMVIPDASHALIPEEPEAVADAITNWAGKLR